MNQPVVEIAEVGIKSGVSQEEFTRAAQKVHDEFLSKQPGFIKHESYMSPEGSWVDLVYWNSKEAAEKTATEVMKNDLCMQWFSMMDESTAHMRHLALIKSW